MESRVTKLENQVTGLNADAVEHKTIIRSLDKSMQTIAGTMEDMGKVMAGNEVREQSHQAFKLEVISKLNLATERRDADRELHRKFQSGLDRRISLIEQSNEVKRENIASLLKSKNDGLSAWKTTGLTLIVSTTMVVLGILIKGGMA